VNGANALSSPGMVLEGGVKLGNLEDVVKVEVTFHSDVLIVTTIGIHHY
jgi:hypothetical protein